MTRINRPAVRSDLMSNYGGYYADLDVEWRRIGSVEKAKNIIALCGAYPHSSVLELGAGDGSVLERLSERGFGERLLAAEISPSGLRLVKQKAIRRLIGCELFDGYSIPHAEGTFDLIVLSHVLEHVEHPRQLLYAARRAGKRLYIEVPLEHTIWLPRDYTEDQVGHINFYSVKTIRHLLQTCGLQILEAQITNRSRESYLYRNRATGRLRHFIKQALLKLAAEFSTHLFTYHASLVCAPLRTTRAPDIAHDPSQ